MAGYIMTLDSEESLNQCILTGTYSTKMSQPNGKWRTHHEGTFADYLSMKEGDYIFFFIKRKIYGIGTLIAIKDECKYLNYINANLPEEIDTTEYRNRKPLLPYGSKENRCFCIFKPNPYFFKKGVDMDDALSSNPDKFKMLRALWKLSFIKIDDEESQALVDIILKRNEENIFNGNNTFEYNNSLLRIVSDKVSEEYKLKSDKILESCCYKNMYIKHEMAIEAALCEILIKDNNTFGRWDYVSHQVVASPFKAIDYMDKMDVFGYRYIKGYKTRSKYLIVEIKKDAAKVDVVDQIMKYVDWVQAEYAFGDYSMIQAYIVASDFSEDVISHRNKKCIRNYTKGYRPTISCEWNFVQLVKYTYVDGELEFSII